METPSSTIGQRKDRRRTHSETYPRETRSGFSSDDRRVSSCQDDHVKIFNDWRSREVRGVDFSHGVELVSHLKNEAPAPPQSAHDDGTPFKPPHYGGHANTSGGTDSSCSSASPVGDMPFDILLPRRKNFVRLNPSLLEINKEKRNSAREAVEMSIVLRPGMVVLKRFLLMDQQIKIVKQCSDLGVGPGGFYQPVYRDGGKMLLKMMCLGQNWDPNASGYGPFRVTDGSRAPDIPDFFLGLVHRAIRASHDVIKQTKNVENPEEHLPPMIPDICIVNFYSRSGKLGLHQDKDESPESLSKGLPVVSFSIGDSCEFLYGDVRDPENAEKVVLESGDVLLFGGKSRSIFHGVRSISPNTAPKSLLDATCLRPGRLNLTFRKF